jgi:hypothetical protein
MPNQWSLNKNWLMDKIDSKYVKISKNNTINLVNLG